MASINAISPQVKLVYRYRVKGSASIRSLNSMAARVNLAWNACNDAQRHAVRWNRPWLSGYDLDNEIMSGACKLIGLGAETLQAISAQYAQSRRQHRKRWLRYRGKRTLGWIPFKARGIRQVEDGFKFMGHVYRVWLSRPLGGQIRCGSFSQDAFGRWYINLCCEVPLQPSAPTGAIGVDLGIKTAAVMSDGTSYDGGRPYREIEPKLAIAQRARKKKRVAALHAKAKNRRKDALHKLSTKLVRENAVVAVGNVSSKAVIRTRLAKGALDAGWGMFKTMLAYKVIRRQVSFQIVDEYNSTQLCSACGSLPASRPKGIAALGIRQWVCSDCGASHDRDVNAARNILSVALSAQRPAEGILCL